MFGSIQTVKEVSSRGEIRIVITDEAECSVDSFKHCGRIWEER